MRDWLRRRLQWFGHNSNKQPESDQRSAERTESLQTYSPGQCGYVRGTRFIVPGRALDSLLCFLSCDRAHELPLTEALVWNVAQWLSSRGFYQPPCMTRIELGYDGFEARRANADDVWQAAVVLTGGPDQPLGRDDCGKWFAFTIKQLAHRWAGGVELGFIDRVPTEEPRHNTQELGKRWLTSSSGVWNGPGGRSIGGFRPSELCVGDRVKVVATEPAGNLEIYVNGELRLQCAAELPLDSLLWGVVGLYGQTAAIENLDAS